MTLCTRRLRRGTSVAGETLCKALVHSAGGGGAARRKPLPPVVLGLLRVVALKVLHLVVAFL
jgi:hypothetical protein